MKERKEFYIRYSDDLIVLSKEKDVLAEILQEMTRDFEMLGLTLNEKKTVLGEIANGFDFLGYHFDTRGKSVPAKAEQNLEERLEAMWISSSGMAIEDKCKKAFEIIGGWQQYFREDRLPGTIYEFVALVFASGLQSHGTEMKRIREDLVNNCRDIMEYLSGIWCELLEYEQFYMGENISPEKPFSETLTMELLEQYRRYLHQETREAAIEIMQLYTDLSEYAFARNWQERVEMLEKIEPKMEFSDAMRSGFEDTLERISDEVTRRESDDELKTGCDGTINTSTSNEYQTSPIIADGKKDDVIYNGATATKFLRTFVGREDIYSRETMSYGKKAYI